MSAPPHIIVTLFRDRDMKEEREECTGTEMWSNGNIMERERWRGVGREADEGWEERNISWTPIDTNGDMEEERKREMEKMEEMRE